MATDQWLGTELAGYRIDALIGRGGAGVVYWATQLRLQRPAAVKLLAPTLAADAEYRRRFERETHVAALTLNLLVSGLPVSVRPVHTKIRRVGYCRASDRCDTE
jgi:serine/threonine protein kinase